jgi:hypothetical protein
MEYEEVENGLSSLRVRGVEEREEEEQANLLGSHNLKTFLTLYSLNTTFVTIFFTMEHDKQSRK